MGHFKEQMGHFKEQMGHLFLGLKQFYLLITLILIDLS